MREFVELAFAEIGRTIRWQGKGVHEKGVDAQDRATCWSRSIRATSGRRRSTLLLGDPTKAHAKLGWKHRTSFRELVKEMVAADLIEVEREYRHHDRPD